MKETFKRIKNILMTITLAAFSLLICSCEKILQVENPSGIITRDAIFKDDATAKSAITGMYASMLHAEAFASGSIQSVTGLAGLSSDDFSNYLEGNLLEVQFDTYNLRPDNSRINTLWKSAYKIIYQANAATESIRRSEGMSKAAKDQLLGESLFVRAFAYFYLANLFGDVPLITSTDYITNTSLPRSGVDLVYNQILSDILEAQALLSVNYPSAERVRPNKLTATALLARVYLYKRDWINAELQASKVIDNTDYFLETDLNEVFLANSKEAIWQLRPVDPYINTNEGNAYILNDIPYYYYLSDGLVNSFEAGDARLSHWVSSFGIGPTFYFPYKYKVQMGGPGSYVPAPLTEYSMVFRLAEQYLIRAEARAQENKLATSINDVDMIRSRAGLSKIALTNPSISKENLLLAIEHERRSELFTEWGHRWFDLKRTNRATTVLAGGNPGWAATDMLYPIPGPEFLSNRNLGKQNPGY